MLNEADMQINRAAELFVSGDSAKRANINVVKY
jgi:hypothetical protein